MSVLTVILEIARLVVLLVFSGLVVWLSLTGLRNARATNNMINAFDSMAEAFTHQQHSLQDLVDWTVPPEEWGEVIGLHRAMRDKGSEHLDYLVYCDRHGGYFNVRSQGYTRDYHDAKRFTAAEGLILVLDRARNGDATDSYALVGVPKQTNEELNQALQ